VDDKIISEFLLLAEKNGVKKEEKQYALSEKLIQIQLKALIAQKMWDLTSFFAIINQEDKEVQKAIDVIQSDMLYMKYQSPH
jgi:carboxyl-terminal processing protease